MPTLPGRIADRPGQAAGAGRPRASVLGQLAELESDHGSFMSLERAFEVDTFEHSLPGYSLIAVSWLMRQKDLPEKAAMLREVIAYFLFQKDRGRTNLVGVGWLIQAACAGLDR